MAYDRYDRDERSRWSNDRFDRGGRRDERGFWDRASDEVASWFGDDDAERRRRQDTRHDERMGDDDRNRPGNDRNWQRDRERADYRGPDYDRDRTFFGGSRSDRDFNEDRDRFSSRRGDWGDKFRTSDRGGFSDRDYNPSRHGRGYRPVTGDYGRGTFGESDQFFAASGYGAGERGFGDYDRSQTPYGRDEYRRTSFAGSRDRGEDRDFDPHYRNWRDRHIGDLDRDYDDYRREHQSKFENDFTSWREKRQQKRGMLGQIREHMEVVGSDDQHVGTVDKTAGDRIILTKSDPDSGGAHHSLSCSEIDRIEGDKVILDCSADEAKNRWRDESRSRALFEREDQGEMGPRGLNRSFEGTYR
ncbi:MAG TPA: DUF2171 domain-containing protein [Sphingomicrobium sp.]